MKYSPIALFVYNRLWHTQQTIETLLNNAEAAESDLIIFSDGPKDESFRVLMPGGLLLMTVPFVWDEHAQPHNFARYSSCGIWHLLEKHRFEIMKQRKSVDDVCVIFQLINAYIYKKTVRQNGWINLVLTVLLMAPFNVLGELLHWLLPRNADLYLDNIALARKERVPCD